VSILLFALGAAGLAATAALAAASTRQVSVLGFALAAYVFAVGEIVLVTLILSPARFVGAWGYLVAESVVLAVVVAAWSRAGRPRAPRPALAWTAVARNPVLAWLAVAVGVALAYSLVVVLAVPPNNSDSMTYRLSRAVAWLQHGGLYWIGDPHTERQNEFPANSELEFLYTLALLGRDTAAALPQLAAAVVVIVGVAGCARRLGYGRGAALFAGLIGATLTEFALQATSTQNDLVTASLVAAAAYFVQSPRSADLMLAGAAVGLALGTKITAYLVLPTLTLLAVLALPRRRLVVAGAATVAGVAVFAGYSLALNIAHTGSPFGESAEVDLYRPVVTARGTVSITARAAYRFIDFSGLPVPPELRLRLEGGGERVFDVLGIAANPPESSATLFTFQINLRAHEDHSFFGPLGIAVLPVALAFLIALPLRRTTARRAAAATSLPLFIVTLALVLRFDDEGRYLLVPLALLLPLAAAIYHNRLLASVVAAVATITLAAAHVENELKPTGLGAERAAWQLSRAEAQSLDVSAREPLLTAIAAEVPLDAVLGAAIAPSDWGYPLYGETLERRLIPLDPTCPVREADRRRLRYLVLGAALPWPGLHRGWRVHRFPGAGTLLVRAGPLPARPSRLPCFSPQPTR
jgi:dolichyl-phosphate-mannose-protein mannosyltransferase